MTRTQMNTRELGTWGENLAAAHLKEHGWGILARNWRTRGGELDIVAFDPQRQAIVAVEVKTRRSHHAGTPAESVTTEKVRRIKGLLLTWLLEHGTFAAQITVDVLAVDVTISGEPSISHVKDVS
ncbi:YraN family protein [Trueperella pecoris]|uniref:YraN family protein n=1 Tax=Trueperella pecoris TaxID=2733571 RepID=UPI00186B6CF9|nr:YraN family protein [Trueperella pecoris]QOQ39094.1 YraN family protein [Trueperella pecoris]